MSQETGPPTMPVIVEHLVTDDGLTLCSGHKWRRIEGSKVARYLCPLCRHFVGSECGK